MKRVAVVLLILGACGVFVLLAASAVRLWPAELTVRVDPSLSQSAILITDFGSVTRSPIPASGAIRVPVVSHAMYRVDLPLSDGEHLWAQYVHTDSGVRRRVDMHFSPSASPGSCHVRVAANRWFFSQRLVLLDADVWAKETTEEHPKGVW
jgi:hypothetical protein